MEQGKLPRLTKSQLERFREFLVYVGRAESLTDAEEITNSWAKCKEQFFQVIVSFELNYSEKQQNRLIRRFSLGSIFAVYRVNDEPEEANQIYDKGHLSSNFISDKASDSPFLANCISDKVVDSVDLPNQIYDKGLLGDDEWLSNQIYDKVDNEGGEPSNQIYDKGQVRGKQKEPLKVPFLLRLDNGQHEKLKALGGNTSEHIRQAIGLYLDSVQNQTV